MNEDDENISDVLEKHASAIMLMQDKIDDLTSRSNVLETTQIALYAIAFFASILVLSAATF